MCVVCDVLQMRPDEERLNDKWADSEREERTTNDQRNS